MFYFEGTRVFPVPFMHWGKWVCAVTLPGLGILADKSIAHNQSLLRHEFGHILQRRYFGWWFFWFRVAPASLWSAIKGTFGKKHRHGSCWCEISANKLSNIYFKRKDRRTGSPSYEAKNLK
ncbi:MAG: hypothetical protein MJZ24_09340 [Paludibacteraceae bacterium]|nr:hypothetical protein [Candidatus Physcocola equi]MCQ2234926.1 hypothetical protein [Paludibacteraceae bacterium]